MGSSQKERGKLGKKSARALPSQKPFQGGGARKGKEKKEGSDAVMVACENSNKKLDEYLASDGGSSGEGETGKSSIGGLSVREGHDPCL